MYITRKHLSRRTVLKGAGYALSLPLLDAMIPAATALAKTAAAPKLRVAFVYFPHGAVMDQWTPKKEGPDFDLPPILAPLKPFQKQLTVISGLENKSAIAAPVHAITPGTWLSCVPPRISHDPYGGITIDQIIAKHIGQETPIPSLEVATEERGGEGSCDRNYGCSYGKTISFRDPTTPLPMEHNPRKLFQQMFGAGDTADERVRLARESKSILDLVSREAHDLRKTLGPRDRAALDDYLATVREIERRIQQLENRDLGDVELPDAPAGIPSRFDEHIRLMFDLIALAYQANLTRVVSFMMAAEVSNQPYSFMGVPDAFHPLSHHANNPNKLATLARVQAWNTGEFARFVAKLQALPDGEGNMLDNAIIMFGSNMSDSNAHNHFPLPMALVGGGAGKLKGNRHLRYPDKTPIANLHLTVLQRVGVPMESFGDSTGTFSEV
jgi:BMFP domain-containing protein YqiC